jgi:hypothetical protein
MIVVFAAYAIFMMLFVMLTVGWIPALIAKRKGRSFLTWWVYGGLGFPPALFHSLYIADDKKVMEALRTLDRCEGCGVTFPSFNFLTKVEQRGYLCAKCLADSGSAMSSNVAAQEEASTTQK